MTTTKRETPVSGSTLHLQWPVGQTLGLAIIILVVLICLTEAAARMPLIQARLPLPSVGSGHTNFDLKLVKLERYVAKEGAVDCIFLGPSAVNHGLDPETFQQTYASITHKNLRCFNFGIGGLRPSAAALLAELLVKLYRPRLLVWGTVPPMYIAKGDTPREFDVDLSLTTTPWVQHHLGKPNFNGWLVDHSYAYRYYLRFRIWLEQTNFSRQISQAETELTFSGFNSADYVLIPVHLPISPQEKALFSPALVHSEFLPRQLDGLEKMLQLKSKTNLVVVEMPVHHTALQYYGEGSETHEKLITEIGEIIANQEVLFLPTTHLNLIPDAGWKDRSHMLPNGAQIFSRWLGEQIGQAVNQGLLPDPTTEIQPLTTNRQE